MESDDLDVYGYDRILDRLAEIEDLGARAAVSNAVYAVTRSPASPPFPTQRLRGTSGRPTIDVALLPEGWLLTYTYYPNLPPPGPGKATLRLRELSQDPTEGTLPWL